MTFVLASWLSEYGSWQASMLGGTMFILKDNSCNKSVPIETEEEEIKCGDVKDDAAM